jgi:hypothetical protein
MYYAPISCGNAYTRENTFLGATLPGGTQCVHFNAENLRGMGAQVRAAEQHIDLEHLKAQQQARAYERHLTKLNDAVFPRSMEDSVVGKHSHAVSHALVDDMHVPKITKADYERHPMMKAAHGSNKLYRRVRNSGRDFAKQVCFCRLNDDTTSSCKCLGYGWRRSDRHRQPGRPGEASRAITAEFVIWHISGVCH